MINDLFEARKTLKPVTRPTSKIPNMTTEEAYKLQKQLVEKLKSNGDIVAGYKLSPKTIKDAPVYGYLFESMKIAPGTVIKKTDFIDLHLENEVAFIIGQEINSSQINKPSDLKSYVKYVVPAIEMPEIRYSGDIDDVTGLDLVVDNVVASKIILGKGMSPDMVDADKVKVIMTRDGVTVNEGLSTMVEGSPWNSLFWLVKELDKKDEKLKVDYVIMTGGIAKFMDSTLGVYKATYEGLGEITFTILA